MAETPLIEMASSHTPRPPKQRQACLFCDRTFSKPAHLIRHQRSHTGERPYKCRLCLKRFSRRDVLVRHTKNHTENSVGGEDGTSVSTDQEPADVNYRSSNDDKDNVLGSNRTPGLRGLRSSGPIASSLPVDAIPNTIPAFSAAFDEHEQIPQSSPLNLDPLATIATELETTMRNNQDLLEVLPDNQDHIGLWGINGSRLNATTHANEAFGQNPSHQISSNFSTSLDFFDNNPFFVVKDIADTAEWIKFQNQHFLPTVDDYQQDQSSAQAMLQSWLHQLDDSSHSLQLDVTEFETMDRSGENRRNGQSAENSPIRLSPGLEVRSAADNIPKELFEKVQQCWPTPPRNRICIMPILWQNAISKAEDNLFSCNQIAYETQEKDRPPGSRWGIDNSCRERLQMALESQPSGTLTQSPEDRGFYRYSNNIVLPPADILDIGMDLYFRHFHPLVPFIHMATFHVQSTPASMLLAMCLLGLASIKTKEAKAVIQNSFAKLLGHVHAELFPTVLARERNLDVLTTLATAFMMVCLSGISGEAEDRDQCQVLYVNAILVAQQHGLFDAKSGQILDENMFAHVSDLDLKWKAWARVESAKRIIVCLIIVDSWYAGFFHSSPNIRTDTLCFIMPCDRRLFQAKTSATWARLVKGGQTITMPLVDLSCEPASFPKLSPASSLFGLHGLLSAIRLQISETYYRLISRRPNNEQRTLVPWDIFVADVRARRTLSLLANVLESYGTMLQQVDPNCMMLWHNMNVMLCADFRIFELGAGRAGADQARKALDDIQAWSDTPAARRACIHAGQMFKLMSDRRSSDGTMFHSAVGLFMSALVLGLYILKARIVTENGSDDEPNFDLLDDIDWKQVKDEGYVRCNQFTDDPALNFIRNGGKIVFAGVEHHPGYTSARRILLDYACLLEDCMKWNGGRYSPILRVMSDALADA